MERNTHKDDQESKPMKKIEKKESKKQKRDKQKHTGQEVVIVV